MLAELAAANAAFAVIKATLKNGKELIDAGHALADYFKNRDTLQKSVNEKKSSSKSKLIGRSAMIQEFFAQEQALASLRQQEEELRELMIYHGRAGMWDDWLQFQADYRRREREEKKAAEIREYNKRVKQQEIMEVGLSITLTVVVFAVVTFFVLQLLSN
jgi:hypothetical protein